MNGRAYCWRWIRWGLFYQYPFPTIWKFHRDAESVTSLASSVSAKVGVETKESGMSLRRIFGVWTLGFLAPFIFLLAEDVKLFLRTGLAFSLPTAG